MLFTVFEAWNLVGRHPSFLVDLAEVVAAVAVPSTGSARCRRQRAGSSAPRVRLDLQGLLNHQGLHRESVVRRVMAGVVHRLSAAAVRPFGSKAGVDLQWRK